MQLTLMALTLVCLVPVFQKTSSPVRQNQTVVELWCGGDDDLCISGSEARKERRLQTTYTQLRLRHRQALAGEKLT